jgi:hypothetical protein
VRQSTAPGLWKSRGASGPALKRSKTVSEHIEDHKQLYEAARSLRKSGMSINQENKELRHEVDRLQSDNREMLKFKEHMTEMRVAHGFDSWAAALVEVDKLRIEKDRINFIESKWFYAAGVNRQEFCFNETWGTPGQDLREAIDLAIAKEQQP